MTLLGWRITLELESTTWHTEKHPNGYALIIQIKKTKGAEADHDREVRERRLVERLYSKR